MVKENKEIQNNNRVEELKKHSEDIKSNIKYSIDRFDILIITISSGGLVLSMNYLNGISDNKVISYECLMILTWISFGSAIIINLFSQVTSYFGNRMELKITRNLIREKNNKSIIGVQSSYECKKRIYDQTTQIFNGLSLFLLVIGVVLLLIFISNNLK